MTGNGLYYTTYIFMVMTGGWFMIVLPTLTHNGNECTHQAVKSVK